MGHMSYSTENLQTIRKQAFFSSNYNLFSLSQEIRAWIISSGIRKQATKQLYRHSRGGRNLFNRIEKIISTSRKENMVNRERSTTLLAINMDLRPNQISLLLVNARSIINKTVPFQQYITEKDTDISIITETWIKMVHDPNTIKEILPLGYKICSHPRRTNRKGGGLVLVYKDSIIINDVTDGSKSYATMEHWNFNINFAGTIVHCHIIHRIPSTSVINFCGELTSIIEDTINLEQGRLLFVGDFNIHMEEPTQPDTITFLEWLESFNLTNHVTFGTHQSNHTLDLVITKKNDASIKSIDRGHLFLDHHFIDFCMEVQHVKPTPKLVAFRKLKKIDHGLFSDDIISKLLPTLQLQNDKSVLPISDLVDSYNHILQELLNTHAPLKTKVLKQTHLQPWFNDTIREEIQLRWKKERWYKQNPTKYNFTAFYHQCRYVANLTK